jgi:hypothetical protein
MTTNIAKTAPINAENGVSGSAGITVPVSNFQKSQLLLEKTVRYGWKKVIYYSAVFYNIKTFSEAESEGKTFLDFLGEMNISPTNARRYLRIGKRLTETVYRYNNF